MSDIDERVVEMKFNNREFGKNASDTLSMLDKLKRALRLDGAGKGFADVQKAAGRFSVAGMIDNVGQVGRSFSAMSVVAITALATIVNKAVQSGIQIAKALTVAPVMSGLQEYETNLNSIQTILANTQWEGTNLKSVNGALEELNHYSDKTIYNFSEMARNIGTFTAAGVKMDTSVSAIKGIANLAALSGSNAQQASTAMYQLSQELAAGRVSLLGWNSVVNAGMGGKVFQDAIMETARAHGVGVDAIVKKEGSFRNSLQTGWLSSEILTDTLNKFTGDMTDAQLKQMGYTDKQIKGIQEMAKTASNAATQVKTFSQLMGTLKEAAGSGWAKTWQLIIGDFEQAKSLWTNVNNVLGGAVQASADARNKVLGDWNKLGGRTVLIEAISNAFKALVSVLTPIKEAFRDIFPAKTGKDLFELTEKLRNFTKGLILNEDTAANVKRTFAGVFAVFSIAGQIIGAVVGAVKRLFDAFGDSSNNVTEFTGGIGDFLVALDKAMKKTGILKAFFNAFADILAIPLRILKNLASAIGSLFDGFDSPGASQMEGAFESLANKMNLVERIADRINVFFSTMGDLIRRGAGKVVEAMGAVGEAIGNGFASPNFDKVLDVINTGLLGGIVLLLRKFVSNGINVNVGGGLFEGIKDTLNGVTGALQTMQTNVRANIILKIAAALALLTASILVLSTLSGKEIASSLTALAAGLGIMMGGLVVMERVLSVMGALKLPFIALGLMGISIAMLAMAGALKIMATMDMSDIGRSLLAMSGGLTAIAVAMRLMPKGMTAQAAAILLISVAMNALATALKLFATLKWDEIARGMAALAGSLVIIAGAMHLMPGGASMVLQAAGLLILGGALNVMAMALKIFATMRMDEIGRGLLVLAGSLVLIAGAMHLMPSGPSMLLQSAGLVAVGVALNLIGGALKIMGGMSWTEIAKGLVALGGAMLILAAGLNLMSGTLGGSAALAVAAAALVVLTPVLVTLGSLDWGTIIKSLAALAGVFVVLGLSGLILGPLVPVILGLAAAMVLIGAGLALAGAGALAFAAAFTLVVGAGAAGIAVLAGILKTFIDQLPMAMRAFATGIVEFAKVIAKAGPAFFGAFNAILGAIIKTIIAQTPQIIKAFTVIVVGLLDAVIKIAPKIGQAFLALINVGLTVLVSAVPKMATAGMNILLAVLNAIAKNVGRFVKVAADIVVNFLNGISQNLPRIIDAGVKLIISFVNGCADAIRNNSEAMGRAGGNLATAMIEGMIKGLKGGIGAVASAAKDVAKGALDSAMGFLGINSPSKEFEKIGVYVNQGFIKGLRGSKEDVGKAYNDMKVLLRDAIKAATDDIAAAQAKLGKLTEARNKDIDAIRRTTRELEQAKAAKEIDRDKITDLETRLRQLIVSRDKDTAAIRETNKAMAEARAERQNATNAYVTLQTQLAAEVGHLQQLGREYDALTGKIDTANTSLENAIKTRDDYNKQISDQYGDLPDISKDTKLADYIENLKQKAVDTATFTDAVQNLRNLGLSDEVYKELVMRGLDALPFVQELVEGGEQSIKEINELGSNLGKEAKKMGDLASRAMYQAGVDAASGVVRGLQSQKAAIASEMAQIAAMIAQTVAAKLKIKSPSRVMAEIGAHAISGLVKGLHDSTGDVKAASGEIGVEAINAMKNSISGMADLVGASVDVNPVIRPVLDLTGVQRDAGKLGSMLKAPLTVDGTYSKATYASEGYNQNRETNVETTPTTSDVPSQLTFVQNNHSPKALSEAEIYRKTNNQLSVAKGALTKP